MCGIFGEFGNSLIGKKKFMELNALSKRRGPDMSGYWSDQKNCQIGFNRLAVLDTSRNGNQPMVSRNGKWVMAMNGEVYNYKDIRKLLGESTTDFNSKTDTEIVLRAFEKWGTKKTISNLNGIFAIALYDLENKVLYLIRDFAGVKPLYYGLIEDKIVFSSQYDQLFEHPSFCSNLATNPESLADYLRFGYISAPNAFFKRTYQLEPGQIMTINKTFEPQKYTYYHFLKNETTIKETDPISVIKLDELLAESVSRQLMSDVSTGAFLSGGIDSPLICNYISREKSNIETFTIGSLNSEIDESQFAKKYAEYLEVINHVHYYTNETFSQQMDEHFKAYSEPFGGFSSLPSFQVCKMAKTYFTVVLGGDGGDELFWGYPRFKRFTSHLSWFLFNPTIRKYGAGIGRLLGNKISYGVQSSSLESWVMDHHSHNKGAVVNALLPDIKNSDEVLSLFSIPKEVKNKSELLIWLRKNEFYGHLQRILMKMDRASMYHSLEFRVPFLDKNILDFSLSIAPELSIKHSSPKYLLKQIIHDKYPSNIINKKKMGFSIDIDIIMKAELRDEICDLLISRDPFPLNMFNRAVLNEYVDDYFKNKHNNYWGIWILFALQKWAQIFKIDNR